MGEAFDTSIVFDGEGRKFDKTRTGGMGEDSAYSRSGHVGAGEKVPISHRDHVAASSTGGEVSGGGYHAGRLCG